MPTYNANTPQPTDTISSTQLPIQTNFASIQTTFDVNHEDFASPDFGKHKFVELPNQGSDPAAAGNEMTLYSKQYNNGTTTQSEAFLKRDAAGTPVPFTATDNPGMEGAVIGYYFLPCGLVVKYGIQALVAGTNVITGINMTQGPTFTKQVSAMVTLNVTTDPNNYHVSVRGQNGDTLTVVSTASLGFNILYMAIGTV